MAPRVIDNENNYEQERTKFDQMRPILASASSLPSSDTHSISSNASYENPQVSIHTTINTDHTLTSDGNPSSTNHIFDIAGNNVPTISVLVHSSLKPMTPTHIHECYFHTHPLRSFWIQTMYEQYDKNALYRVFTKPIPKTSLSSEVLILKLVLAPTVKPTDISSLWNLNIRHCVNGWPMKGLIEYGATRASTVHPDNVRFQL